MDRIGRYNILGEIGRGAMGVVYRALDPTIGRTVAIKTMCLSDLADAAERGKLRDRMFREAQSAGMLSHPHIVTIYDVAEQDDLAYIAMEYVDGPTLDRLVASDPPDGKTILSFLSQTAAALDYAHKRGIVHRDIKPANLMINEGTSAKVTDFGVAKFQSQQMTQAGSMIGTPNYMSPEQIQGHAVDGRSDQFSLGVIAYELLTGEKPFVAESMPALVFKIVREDPVPVQNLNTSLTWAVDTVVKRALAKNPDDRYPSCSDFAFALENACRSAKGWKPIAPGTSMQDTPTLLPHTPVPAKPVTATAPAIASESGAAKPVGLPVSKPLRIARILALVVLAAGIVSALMVAGFDYFSGRDSVSIEGVKDETAPKPAATSPRERTVITPPGLEDPSTNPITPPPGQLPGEESALTSPATGASATRFTTNPSGAFLVADGNSALSCTAPCSLELSPGRHTLSATLEGYRRTLKIFETPKEPEIFLNLDRISGTLMVRTEPPGAAISVDGQARNEKTPAMISLPIGKHSIELVREGGHRETHEIEIKDSVITNLAVTIEAR